ncbi:MAG: 50S ribosomal protein L15 [Candidatus Latescibacteria bacterium]|nr:50S ribosomal protein L15 [Candidatus Latescibacterota bacterium]
MNLGCLRPPKGAVKKSKRVGRGPGSGHGGTSCRGENGQKSRAGSRSRAWFEGGQTPLVRRVPKKGFSPRTTGQYQIVNLRDLNRCELTGEVTPQILFDAGLIKDADGPVKVLGTGDLKHSLKIIASAFSEEARRKIEMAGGGVSTL